MFFKRRHKEKPAEAADTPEAEPQNDGKAADGGGAPSQSQGLSADALRRSTDAASLGFKTTADLEPEDGPFGQDRALLDLDFGLKMRGRDFNIFVLGPPGSGKRTAVRAQLAKAARGAEPPPDWVYVTRFEDPHRLRALSLPAGRAPLLAKSVAAALAELRATLPAAFEAADYRARHRAIEEDYRSAHDDALDALHAKAAEQNIAVLRTPLGFGMAPMHDGQVVKPEVFNQLPQVMRRDVESRVGALQSELEAILTSAPAVDKERRRQLAALDAETGRHPIEAALDEVSQAFADLPEVTAFLADMERDLVANAHAFLPGAAPDAVPQRYALHIVTTRAHDAGAPVIDEGDPTPQTLIGHIARCPHGGGLATHALHLRAGTLHKANGGSLVIEAGSLLSTPAAWDTLKRALRRGEIRVGSAGPGVAGLSATGGGGIDILDPDPIPLDVKVILTGTPGDYDRLQASDPDFAQLFKVRVSFEPTIARSAVNDNRLARLVASMAKAHALKPFDAGGVARLIEEASRIASHRDQLTLKLGHVGDIAREADVWSKHAGRDVTTAEDVTRAIKERAHRARTLSSPPAFSDATRPGQVIGLGTIEAGALRFGVTHRVAARVHAGRGRLTDFVSEGAADARRAAAILRSYLAGTLAGDLPLALAATLTVEPPSSGGADNGASLAEVLALISALADQPLRRTMAVAGTVDPWGDVQPVDWINEQIEGFFDACQSSSLSGTPGVLIPDHNRAHLMLREDVVDAVRDGRFVLHAVKTVDEALTLMTERETGVRGADGQFGADTVKGRVDAKLRGFAEAQRAFGRGADKVTGAREGRA